MSIVCLLLPVLRSFVSTTDKSHGKCMLSAIISFHLPIQANIMATSVLIVGCGGLGSPCALYLAGAGIGRIGLVDRWAIFSTYFLRVWLHLSKHE